MLSEEQKKKALKSIIGGASKKGGTKKRKVKAPTPHRKARVQPKVKVKAQKTGKSKAKDINKSFKSLDNGSIVLLAKDLNERFSELFNLIEEGKPAFFKYPYVYKTFMKKLKDNGIRWKKHEDGYSKLFEVGDGKLIKLSYNGKPSRELGLFRLNKDGQPDVYKGKKKARYKHALEVVEPK